MPAAVNNAVITATRSQCRRAAVSTVTRGTSRGAGGSGNGATFCTGGVTGPSPRCEATKRSCQQWSFRRALLHRLPKDVGELLGECLAREAAQRLVAYTLVDAERSGSPVGDETRDRPFDPLGVLGLDARSGPELLDQPVGEVVGRGYAEHRATRHEVLEDLARRGSRDARAVEQQRGRAEHLAQCLAVVDVSGLRHGQVGEQWMASDVGVPDEAQLERLAVERTALQEAAQGREDRGAIDRPVEAPDVGETEVRRRRSGIEPDEVLSVDAIADDRRLWVVGLHAEDAHAVVGEHDAIGSAGDELLYGLACSGHRTELAGHVEVACPWIAEV